MREFFVGLLVLIMIAVCGVAGLLLFPLLLVMGFFLRIILSIFIFLFMIWVVGKLTLVLIDYTKKNKPDSPPQLE